MLRPILVLSATLALAQVAWAQEPPPNEAAPFVGRDFIQCAATAARRAQVMKEAQQVLGHTVADLQETAALVPRYFKIGCALSTVASAHDVFEGAQSEYDKIVKAVAEQCKFRVDCLSTYVKNLDARLGRCAAATRSQQELLRKLVPVAQPACTIHYAP